MRTAELTRKATFAGAVDLAARTVPVVLSTGAPVKRWEGFEVLDLARVDLSRGDLPLIETHDTSRVNIGQVRRLRVDGGVLRGDAAFGLSARATELLADVQAGIVTGISIGYAHTDTGTPVQLRDGTPALSFGFQPHEVSIVPVPADVGAGFNRSLPGVTMTTTTNTAADPAEVRTLARSLPEGFADALIATGVSLEQARATITNEMARRDLAAGGHRNITPPAHFTRAAGDIDQAREQMISALHVARFGARGDVAGNPYVHSRVIDMGRDCLELRGIRTGGLSPTEIIQRSITTGDLPNIFTGTGHRLLQDSFATYDNGIHRAARKSTIADFRSKVLLRFSEAPELLLTNEHGEFKYGGLSETAESYRLFTYGRIVSLTRQAIINDDLGALQSMPPMFARAAHDKRASLLVAQFALNSGAGATMEDGTACFHVDHGNIATGGGSVLQASSLVTARKSMRLQKDVGGRTLLDLVPRFLLVPAALEHTAQQLIADISPTAVADVNAAGRGLSLIVDPRLDTLSTTAWYLAADPAAGGLEYSYLAGAEGPVFEQDAGFEIDGLSFKCRLDIGAATTEWRTLYKSVGA